MSRHNVSLFIATLTSGGTTEESAREWLDSLPDTMFNTIGYEFVSCSYFRITLKSSEHNLVSSWFTTDLHNCPRLRKDSCDICSKMSLASLVAFGDNKVHHSEYILQTQALSRVGLPLLGLKDGVVTYGLYP